MRSFWISRGFRAIDPAPTSSRWRTSVLSRSPERTYTDQQDVEAITLNFGMLFRWGSMLMGMAQDPNIHMLFRGAWGGIRRLRTMMDPPPPSARHPAGPGMKQTPGGGTAMRGPSEIPGVRPHSGDSHTKSAPRNPAARRIPGPPDGMPMPVDRDLQQIPGWPPFSSEPAVREYQPQNGPLPWMQQQAKQKKPQQQRNSKTR